MTSRKVVNIINFIRGAEPRLPMDLHAPVSWQMEMARRFSLPTTWLLQYDALLDDFYVGLLKQMPASHECGLWFEIPQPLCEACKIPWRGRYSWDWLASVDFSVGYLPEERERLADEFVRLFTEKLGYAPRTAGSWFFDAHLLNYLHERHGIVGACNCKDQWGTDGYTLWGGYWANAYYPSRLNSYMPAQRPEAQIPVPVFRMLGSDPIYQYEADPNCDNGQQVVTLEPVYSSYAGRPCGGGAPKWVDWFMKSNFEPPAFHLSYAQAGQENSFGLERIRRGMQYQYPLLARLRDQGLLEVETLEATSRWYRQSFPVTATTSVCALEDWIGDGRQAIWYLCANGRISLTRLADGVLAIRDWQLFSDRIPEQFLKTPCRSGSVVYEALPICDGMRWGGARFAFVVQGRRLTGRWAPPEFADENTMVCRDESGALSLTMARDSLLVEHAFPELSLVLEGGTLPELRMDGGRLVFSAQGMDFGLRLPPESEVSMEPGRVAISARGGAFRVTSFVGQ